MRRFLPIGTLVALVMVSAAAGSGKPKLELLTKRPQVIVRGIDFRPAEAVTLRLIGRSTTTTVATAGARGSFRASLKLPKPFACGRLILRATGSKGSAALIRIGSPECNPPDENGST